MTSDPLQTLVVESGNQAALALMAQMHRRAFSAQDEKAWSASTFQQLLTSPGVVGRLFKQGDQPIGFAVVRSVLDEAELITLAVDPATQGQGHARQMLSVICANLCSEGIATFFLEVRQDNERAIKLYKAYGFQKISTRKNYYQTTSGKRIDALIFSLKLE